MVSKRQDQPFLSIIIPAYNEEHRLPDTLNRIALFLEYQNYPAEVLVIDNGSTDRTGEIIAEFTTHNPLFHQLYEPCRGKGAAVRTGVLAARGDYILISDADLSVPIEEVHKFVPLLSTYDVAVGSREVPGSYRYGEPIFRHLMGRIFNFIVQWLILPGIRDTQCGFKCFRRPVAYELFSSSTVDGWGFDVEILYTALLKRYQVIEVPIRWYYRKESKVNLLLDPWRMLKEVLKLWGRKMHINLFF